jgi:hypothetical protein
MKMSPEIWAFGDTTTRFDAVGHALDEHGNYCVAFGAHRAGCRGYRA